MKRKTIIWIASITYCVLSVLIIFIATKYVERKSERDYSSTIERFNDFFGNKDIIVSALYSGKNVSGIPIPIPRKPYTFTDPTDEEEKEKKEFLERKSYLASKSNDSLLSTAKSMQEMSSNNLSSYGDYSQTTKETGLSLEKLRLDFEKIVQKDREEEINLWKKKWGNVSSYFEISSNNGLLSEQWDTDNFQHGWCLYVLEKVSNYCFNASLIYPNRAAFKLPTRSGYINNIPTIQEAVEMSFDYYKDRLQDYFVNDHVSYLDIKNVLQPTRNSYFFAYSYQELENILGKEFLNDYIENTKYNLWKPVIFDKSNIITDYSTLTNPFWDIYINRKMIGQWTIEYDAFNDPRQKDKLSIILWGEIFILLLFLSLIIPMIVKEKIRSSRNKENIKQTMLRVCNPQQFLKPYDEVKISIANDIYEKIISTPVEEKDTLKELRKEAANKLGVIFIDTEKKKELLAASNPQKFMKPYNAEKIRIANHLFSKLQNECIDVDDFEIIEQEIKNKLYTS